jgi:hypothetical protein
MPIALSYTPDENQILLSVEDINESMNREERKA